MYKPEILNELNLIFILFSFPIINEAYNKFLTMPKYIVLSSNDEQYMPDCTKYFYQSMKEPVFLR